VAAHEGICCAIMAKCQIYRLDGDGGFGGGSSCLSHRRHEGCGGGDGSMLVQSSE
jgi:hypothetical protein